MLPMALAAGVLSLRAGHRCAALSVAVRLDDDGAIADQRLERTWIKPRYGLTYEDADDLIELAPPGMTRSLVWRSCFNVDNAGGNPRGLLLIVLKDAFGARTTSWTSRSSTRVLPA